MYFYIRLDDKRCYRRAADAEEFFYVWSESYLPTSTTEKLYGGGIAWDMRELKGECLLKLWKFKADPRSNRPYKRSVEVLGRINEFRTLPKASDSQAERFWNDVARHVSERGFVHQVFTFHVARPIDYPIVDQHAMRAYKCLCSSPPKVCPAPPAVWAECVTFDDFQKRYDPYLRFWHDLMQQLRLSPDNLEHCRRLDAAMRSFGMKLSKDYQPSDCYELDVA
jgi:hypothetical protein